VKHTSTQNPYLDQDLLETTAITIDPQSIAGEILEAMMDYGIAPHSQNAKLLWVNTYDQLRDAIRANARQMAGHTDD